MNSLIRGPLAGAAATVPMTGVIYAAKAAGMLYMPPPAQITANAEAKSGATADSQAGFTASWLAAHFGFGAAMGLAYEAARPLLPSPSWLGGMLFGAGVWAVSYLKVLPSLGLYPPPQQDSNARTATMVVAHLVYGAAVAAADQRLQG
jgi:uncharacterized membrane protein YagU involved in acid resistance